MRPTDHVLSGTARYRSGQCLAAIPDGLLGVPIMVALVRLEEE
jgi:hypothetical protein